MTERINENERIGNMTWGELKAWVNQLLDRRMPYTTDTPIDQRTPDEILASIRHNRLKRQPGQPSVVEMIRDDRDR